MSAAVQINEFFCLNCRLTGQLDLHGRCATCGSDAVTHPLRYQLHFLEADGSGMREKKIPLTLNLEGNEYGSRGFALPCRVPGTLNNFLQDQL